MRLWIAAVLLAGICLVVYWPHKNAEFILDDYYTVVRNPLIKNPSLYQNIWTSRLFDAHQSSGYIKFGYYRPLLQCSWILDYRLFGLKTYGYQWINLLIHAINSFLVCLFVGQLFGQIPLGLKTALLFSVLPTQEWVVRYVTGRGDELSALFAFVSLIMLVRGLKTKSKNGYVWALVFWALAALTREVAISYVLCAVLIVMTYSLPRHINRFSLYWVLIGILPIILIGHNIPKQGNILVLHILYFGSVGFCLWLAQLRFKWVVLLFAFFAAASFYQGQFWTTEDALLRHTRSLEWWPRTVVDQQLLMRYDDDMSGINDMVNRSHDPLIKSMWLRRLGTLYFEHRDLSRAQGYLLQSLSIDPLDVDSLNALAVVCHYQGREDESLKYLRTALAINPSYPDTLKTLGIYYYIHKNLALAHMYLTRCLFFDPDNRQARKLLELVNKAMYT